MNDRRRYRLNAAECLSVASTSHSDYRSLLLCIATSWLALAREEDVQLVVQVVEPHRVVPPLPERTKVVETHFARDEAIDTLAQLLQDVNR